MPAPTDQPEICSSKLASTCHPKSTDYKNLLRRKTPSAAKFWE